MKSTLAILCLFISSLAYSYEIEGTLILKGSLKTEIILQNKKTTCKVKVAEVKNLLEEDQFGNPGYKVKLNISLSGGDFLSPDRIKFDQTYLVTNKFESGVKDLEYSGSGVYLHIHKDGRLNQVKFPYKNNFVTCKF